MESWRPNIPLGACAVLALALPAAGQAGAPTAILPVAAAPPLAAEIELGVPRAIVARGGAVLGPRELGARLAAAEGVAAALAEARSLLQRASKSVLNMEREAALSAARRAVSTLARVHARFHARRLLARAHGLSALALLLRPADALGARAAFRSALLADPSFTPEEDLTPPPAFTQFRLAQREVGQWPADSPPSATELAGVARQARVGRLVWLAARPIASGVALEVAVYAPAESGATRRRLSATAPRDGAVARVAELVARALPAAAAARPMVSWPATGASGSTERPVVSRPATGASGSTERPPPARRRWYRRWWVWTVAGGVAVGVGVGLGLGVGLRRSPPPGFDFRFIY